MRLSALVLSAAWLVATAAVASAAPSMAGAGGRERGGEAKAALSDEVNVLAHGLLQLGHSLKEHVQQIRGQLRDLSSRVRAHNVSLDRLEGSSRRRDAEFSEQLRGLLRDLEAHKAAVQERLDRLERGLHQQPGDPPAAENGSPRGAAAAAAELSALQAMMGRQNLRIEELFQKIKQQQYRMDKQNQQIQSLQTKVNMLLPLHIRENETQAPKWKPKVLRSTMNRSQDAKTKPLEAQKFPEGCHQLFTEGVRSSGVFHIQPSCSQAFEVFCDMNSVTHDGGGWTVIQRRVDGSVDFDQLWDAYKNGFGNLTGDFWLGLEKIHQITQKKRFHLLIELQDWEGHSEKAQFSFLLGGEDTAYALNILGPFTGGLQNAMGDFPQLPFSTRDRDHDLKGDANCAKHLSGGWWFSTCGQVNLNGKYFHSIPRQRHERKQGIFWKPWKGRYYPLKSTTMKIRPMELEAES